jgi:GDPmannose 4,6-dehydratase
MSNNVAIITGITGQDGAYLAKLLISKGYKIIGVVKDSNNINKSRLEYLSIADQILWQQCELTKKVEVEKLLQQHNPTEFYNLAAQSSVFKSYQDPILTLSFNTLSVAIILECIRQVDKKIKFYQASSGEMYGNVNSFPITENSTLYPVSPYAVSKCTSFWLTVNYRESFGMFCTSGISFNHESYLRNENFIIKKILNTAFDILDGKKEILELGNIDIRRDFGYAPKYVEAMYLMMQHSSPDHYILASGKSVSLKDVVFYIFDKLNISRDKIVVNTDLYRPNEIMDIYGDSSKAKKFLNWEYEISFFDVLDIIIDESIENRN